MVEPDADVHVRADVDGRCSVRFRVDIGADVRDRALIGFTQALPLPPHFERALTLLRTEDFFFWVSTGKPATEYILFTKYITARYYDFGRLGERKRLQTRVDYHTIQHLEY